MVQRAIHRLNTPNLHFDPRFQSLSTARHLQAERSSAIPSRLRPPASSELELQSKLADTGIARPGDASESAGALRHVRLVQVDPVRSIEELGPELEPHALLDREFLENTGVPPNQVRPTQEALADIPVRADCRQTEHRRYEIVDARSGSAACAAAVSIATEVVRPVSAQARLRLIFAR